MKRKIIYIAFTLFKSIALGWPDHVTLTLKEYEAMRLYHLGGADAWRANGVKVACKTNSSW